MRRGRQGEGGFALLLVFAMAAAVAIMLYSELPRAVFESQRMKEEQLVERGEQYKRAIQLYVRKFNKYPVRIEELETANNIRFLRRRYKDPMTGSEEWRLIHVGPGGVLLDSVVHPPPGMKKEGEDKKSENTFITERAAVGSTATAAPGTQMPAGMFRRGTGGQAMPGGTPEGQQFQPAPGQPYPAYPGAEVQPGMQPHPYPGMQPGQSYSSIGQPGPGVPGQPVMPGYPVVIPTPGQPGAFPQPGMPMQPGMVVQPGMVQPGMVQPGMVQPGMVPQPGMVIQPGMAPQPGMVIQPGMVVQPGMMMQPGMYPQPGTSLQPGVFPPAVSLPPGVPGRPVTVLEGSGNRIAIRDNNAPGFQPGMQPGGAAPGAPGGAYVPGMAVYQPSAAGYQPGSFGTAPGVPGQPPANPNPALEMIRNILTRPRPAGAVGAPGSAGEVLGGGIAGVASKFEAESIKVYNDRTKYNEWEFIYDIKNDPSRTGGMGAVGGALPAGMGSLPGGLPVVPQQGSAVDEQQVQPVAPGFLQPGQTAPTLRPGRPR